MNRPENLNLEQLWSEKDLCERFGIRMGKGHSLTIGYWIKGGLKYIEISGRRFFWEHDIIEFMLNRQQRQAQTQDEG